MGKKDKIGHPPLEDEQPELLKAIVDIATYGAPADERRRSEGLRSVKTLDALHGELESQGYEISRSALYLRLLPRRTNSTEGQRHVRAIPVRLRRAFNDAHRSHVDTKFCMTNINYLKEPASVLGPKDVLFISQDDKARVPIGTTAAHKQAPMLMHLEYRVKLPDHDWVVAERHKLIPSVYGIMEVKDGMAGDRHAVTYSGPTYIAIRSGKHSSSTPSSHGHDIDALLSDPEFFKFTRTDNGDVKPVAIFVVDGGPDENPRYEKVINEAIQTFRTNDLDALFIATNAPGRSAYNRVERRMAPLSHELCGLILTHNKYGDHLDNQGRTVDPDLELKNFEYAGETLAEVWSSLNINGHQTKAVYVKPEISERQFQAFAVTPERKRAHLKESHYFLQISKCEDLNGCSKTRSSYRHAFPRFLPAPLCTKPGELLASDNSDNSNCFTLLLLRLRLEDSGFRHPKSGDVPYDLCCPSIRELLPSRTCQVCGSYFASAKSMKIHKKACCASTAKHSALNDDGLGQSFLAHRRDNRPVRVAAKRQKELMIVWSSRLNDEHADWVDEDDLVGVTVEEAHGPENIDEIQVFSLDDHFNVPWEAESTEN